MILGFACPPLACPLCGAAGGLWLFFLILGVFVLMFGGTVLLFMAGVGRGEWTDGQLRWSAVEAENEALSNAKNDPSENDPAENEEARP